jgi:hypothetical protein
MTSDPTAPHPDPPAPLLQPDPQARQLQEGRLSQCMIRCQIRHRCMIRHRSPNATRHQRRLSRSIRRCTTLCQIRRRCAIRHLNQNAAAPPMDL